MQASYYISLQFLKWSGRLLGADLHTDDWLNTDDYCDKLIRTQHASISITNGSNIEWVW